jgi:hypothetical protein
VQPLSEHLGDLAAGGHGGERDAVAEALGHGDDVGDHAEVLEPPVVLAGAAEAGLHLVGNTQAAVLPHDPVGLAEVVGCGAGDPANALNRLGDEGRDPAGGGIADQLADIRGARGRDLLR